MGRLHWIGALVVWLVNPAFGYDPMRWAEHSAPAKPWRFLVLHHSATEAGSVESIDAAHKTRKDAAGNPWRGIGYHFVIGNGHGMEDGEVKATFRWKEQATGAHAGELQYNTDGIGICLIGDFQSEPPTNKQLESLTRLTTYLQAEWQIPDERILGHGQIKSTACPGRHFASVWQLHRGEHPSTLKPTSNETLSPPVAIPTRRPVSTP